MLYVFVGEYRKHVNYITFYVSIKSQLILLMLIINLIGNKILNKNSQQKEFQQSIPTSCNNHLSKFNDFQLIQERHYNLPVTYGVTGVVQRNDSFKIYYNSEANN